MKIIVIGDIHNNFVQAEVIHDKYQDTHKIIYVGDYFDNFGDSAIDADQTARWVKRTLDRPNTVMLFGNHDINYSHYAWSGDHQLYNCSGYTFAKDDAISKVLTEKDWEKLKIAHKENGFWFSHAGFHPNWFADFNGLSDSVIESKLKGIQIALETRSYSNELAAAGRCRGGAHRVGGLLWRDHNQESFDGSIWMEATNSFKQVCGHTPMRRGIDVEELNKGGVCINVDCGLKEILEINEDSTYNVISTGFDDFYNKQHEKRIENQLKKAVDAIGAYDHIYKDLKL